MSNTNIHDAPETLQSKVPAANANPADSSVPLVAPSRRRKGVTATDAVRAAIAQIDSGRFRTWYALPASQATVEQVRAEIAAAGRSGDLAARRQFIGNIGDMIMVYAKRANSVAFLVRAFINSGEAQQWYHFPATGRCGDRAHRAQSVKQAIWRAGLAGQVGYGITDEGYLHLFRRDSVMDVKD